MRIGQGQEAAGRRKRTVALIAMTSEAGAVSVSYRISDKVSGRARRQMAGKLRQIADAITG